MASVSDSSPEEGKTKSHYPFNLATSSSWDSSAKVVVSSSSSSWSDYALEITLGGWEIDDLFFLNDLKGFLEEVSATCFLISTISLDIVLRTFCNPSKS